MISSIDNAVRVDVGASTVGSTGYIDQLSAQDMPANIIAGKDAHGREYVAFRVIDNVFATEGAPRVLVAFQRYTNQSLWVCAGLGVSGSKEFVLNAIQRQVIDNKEPLDPYTLQTEYRLTK